MLGLVWQELVIVLVIIMIIFGTGKLPEVAKPLGQGVKEFKQEADVPFGQPCCCAGPGRHVRDRYDEAVDGARRGPS